MWACLVSLGVFGIGYSSWETWTRYSTGSTITVVETTRHPYAEVPFPSVSVCDVSVDWDRVMALTEDDLPAPFNESKRQAAALLERLGTVGWADFDVLDQIRLQNVNLSTLKTVNVTELLLKVIRPCNEVFLIPCWWRSKEYDCCDIFEIQKTDHGFCWAFNSDTSEESKQLSQDYKLGGYWVDRHGEKRPRRTAGRGPWSGLRIWPTPLPEERMPPNRNFSKAQFTMILSDPRSIPQGWYALVQPGIQGMFAVWGDSLKAKPEVRKLRKDIRYCLYEDEDGGQRTRKHYSQENCLYECYQSYAIKICNCSPEFLIIDSLKTEQPPACTVDGLLCLSANNEIFSYLQPAQNSVFFDNDSTGIICNCPRECNSHQYVTELFAPFQANESVDNTSLDVHFRMSTCVLYSTDIVNDWLDTLVSFGGIAGLFLGGSLMSGVELIYFFTIRLLRFYALNKSRKKRAVKPSLLT